MINATTPVVALVTALTGAVGYGSSDAIEPVESSSARARLNAELRTAQVELSCDHRGQALHAIQRARRELVADAGTAQQRVVLEQAAWQVRHNDHVGAVSSLEALRSAGPA
ncbi:hypothetical protein [Leptothrix discophora]|uniref:Uncharacterized protein n=1 Tax=Leptothrix discophora TaxID=89 RepID=A0ABT9G5S7_LEPDI|nr:hypothetical protein [Leptothrix discophora]MDP4301827.1 hypothetical protein [Leptothrix discophora]